MSDNKEKRNMQAAVGVDIFWQQEEKLKEVTSAAMQEFLASVKDQIAINSATEQPVSLSEIQSLWYGVVTDILMPAVEEEYVTSYNLVRDPDAVTAAAIMSPQMLDYLHNTFDRLAFGLQPPLPLQAYQKVKDVIALGVELKWSTQQVSQRVSEVLSWTRPERRYWENQRSTAEQKLDIILDSYGEPGDPLREAVRDGRVVNNQVSALQKDIADATKALHREQSTWKTRADLIARTESTFAFNAGNLQALLDEGWTHKVWLSADTARPDHKLANGQKVPIGGAFLVGGETMLMPGDPTATASQVCNCRCILLGEDD